MKAARKIFAVLLALVMVFAMSASVLALSAGADASYVVEKTGPSYTEPIQVKVVVDSKEDGTESGTGISNVYDVRLEPTGTKATSFTVLDAIVALNDSTDDIEFYTSDYDYVNADSPYIWAVYADGYLYEPALPIESVTGALDGWYFRLNDQIPLLTSAGTDSIGAGIAQTPLADGDVIHLYWNYPFMDVTTDTPYSVDYLSAGVTYANGTATVQLTKSSNYYAGSDYAWYINNFENYSSTDTGTFTAEIYDAGTGKQVAAGTVNKSGTGDITCNLESGKEYYLHIKSVTYKPVTGETGKTWNILDTTSVYSKFTI